MQHSTSHTDRLVPAVVDLRTVNFEHSRNTQQIPIIYSDSYNPILKDFEGSSYGLVLQKRAAVFNLLQNELGISVANIFTPLSASQEQLKLAHSEHYLKNLESSSAAIVDAFGIPDLKKYSFPELKSGLLEPMRLATGGTLLAVDLAFQYGWSINLSGGFHHAQYQKGAGFCFYNDLAIAALYARDQKLLDDQKVLIIDLDAHQGDGTASILRHNNRVILFDIFNSEIWPALTHKKTRNRIDFAVPIESGTTDETYLSYVQTILPRIFREHNIGLIIYNAGADIHEADPKGRLKISQAGIIDRDQMVNAFAKQHNCPIVTVLSGAYGTQAPQVIATALSQIIRQTEQYHVFNNSRTI